MQLEQALKELKKFNREVVWDKNNLAKSIIDHEIGHIIHDQYTGKINGRYWLKNKNILGHSDIAPLRKKDPGEKFPWEYLFKNKIGIWDSLDLKKKKSLRRKALETKLKKFISYLKRIGYRIDYSDKYQLRKLIKIFQMRFRPELIDGKLDLECFEIPKSLLNIK